MNISIRRGTKEDIPQTLHLIKELAEYENALDQVLVNEAQMEEDGFGNEPIFEFIVAQLDQEIVGVAIYYYRYSTWKGRSLYLEDLVVTESQRGKGIGG
ncbi:MAG: GNAT family N-acetyltransferase, partial [Cyclobacteriaceae bacterium]